MQTKKLKRTNNKPPNNKTVKSCNLSKIQLRKDCCTSPRLQYKLKTSWFHPTHKKKHSLVPPKKETKNVHNYNKNLSWKIFFFWSASFKADFLTLFPISDFRTIKFSIKMVKGAIHRNRFVKRINCIKVSEPFNPQFNFFCCFFPF